jgi:exodeoxyribonuclease VII large subunit
VIFLDVPFREKDEAKALGARWDGVSKKWYIPQELSEQPEPFQRWLTNVNTINTNQVLNHDLQQTLTQTQHHIYSENSPLQTGAQDNSNPKKTEKGALLSTVLRKVQQALRQSFPGATWVVAEIANLNNSRGHLYLELTENNEQGQSIASCRAMIWQSQAQRLLQRFETETGSPFTIGQKVLLLTEISFHEKYGFSMVVQDIDPSYTLGELELNLSNIRKQLITDGIYQQNKQFTLPSDFFRVAVIAPPKAAGLGDFRADADNLQAAGLCDFKYFYSAFQGGSVENEMLSAIEAIHALHHSQAFDALVIIRGGGAKLDLNMLNLYSVAKQLCMAQLPVLTGIGHERDSTILDEISNHRFDTPSKVIAFIRHEIFQRAQQAKSDWQKIEHSSRLMVQYLEQDLSQLNQEITHNSQGAIYRWKQAMEPLQFQIQRLSENRIQSALVSINELRQTIDVQLKSSLKMIKANLDLYQYTTEKESKRVLETKHQQIIQWIALVLSSGPKTQLNRGFNIAKNAITGKPVTTANQALKTKSIQLEFVDGKVLAEIDQATGILKE